MPERCYRAIFEESQRSLIGVKGLIGAIEVPYRGLQPSEVS